MHDAFISYSRHDRKEVARLVDGLEQAGCTCWLDTADLPAGEVWRRELEQAIVDGDNLIFVVSPASIDSGYCLQELEFALLNNKRVIPLLHSPLRKDQTLPANLAQWQWLEVDWGNDAECVARVVKAIRKEAVWRRQSTEYLRRAQRWEAGRGDVLGRVELEPARVWIQSGTRINPGPVDLQLRFIHESEAHHLREAERWKSINARTLARQLAAQAEVLIGRRGVLLETGALLAAESALRAETLQGDRALRKCLGLLPREIARVGWPDGVATRATALSPDGECAAALGADGAVHVWDCMTGHAVAQFCVQGAQSLLFRPGGKHLVAFGSAATVWRVADGTQVAELAQSGVAAASFSSDGEFLATVEADRCTRLWTADDYQAIATYDNAEPMFRVAVAPHATEVITWNADFAEVFRAPGKTDARIDIGNGTGVAFGYSADGKCLSTVVAGAYSTTVYDVATREQLLFEDRHWHCAFSGDGRHFAVASPEWDAHVYDLASCWQAGHYWEPSEGGTLARRYLHRRVSCKRGNSVHHDNSVYRVALSHHGRYLATTSRDGTARVWEPYAGREVLRLVESVVGPVECLGFHRDERHLTGLGKQGFRTWEAVGHRQVAALVHDDAILGVAYSADGHFAATVSRDCTCRVWTMPGGAQVRRIELGRPSWGLHSVALDPCGARLLLDGRELFDLATGDALAAPPRPAGAKRIQVDADWTHALAVLEDDSIAVIDFGTGALLARHDTFGGSIDAAALADTGGLVALLVRGRGLRLWNHLTGQELDWPAIHTETEDGSLSLGRSGRRLALIDARAREIVRVIDLQSPDAEAQVIAHEAAVTSACFDPSEAFLLTTGEDRAARVYQLEGRTRVAEFGHDADVVTGCFSPDGRYVLSAGGRSDRTARLWFWKAKDLIAEVCARLSRDLTVDEWTQYLGEVRDEPYRATRQFAQEHMP